MTEETFQIGDVTVTITSPKELSDTQIEHLDTDITDAVECALEIE